VYWLRRYATSRKVEDSRPDEVAEFFQFSTRNIKIIMFLGSKVGRVRRAEKLTAIYV
jgi:hypothetical protein